MKTNETSLENNFNPLLLPSSLINCFENSAKYYYEYLAETQRGVEYTPIVQIVEERTNFYCLKLSKKLPSSAIDSSFLCITSSSIPKEFFQKDNRQYIDGAYVKICKYNRENAKLYIELTDEFSSYFRETRQDEIKLVSSMLFIVKNVYKWYNKHGNSIFYPPKPFFSEDEIYNRGIESDDQQKSVKTALSNSVSYIWGAPGTGKTQIVLSDCLISYIHKNKRVLVVAPTNNALEQVLRATISSLRDAGESIDCLIRKGAASDEFSRDYGQICERMEKHHKIDTLQNELLLLKSKLSELKRTAKIKHAKEIFDYSIKDYNALDKEYNKIKNKISLLEAELSKNIEELATNKKFYTYTVDKISEIDSNRKKISYKIKAFFDKSFDIKCLDELKELQKNAANANSSILKLDALINSLNAQLCEERDTLSSVNNNLSVSITKIKESTIEVFGGFESVDKSKYSFLNLSIESSEEDIKDLENLIVQKEEQLEALNNLKKVEMKDKLVIACTVDYLLFTNNYEDIKMLDVSHIFLDEAAYCPMIKAGILFSLYAPVTFLGDHMQLPPVCEANESFLRTPENMSFMWSQSAIYFPQIFETNGNIDILFNTFRLNLPPSVKKMAISILIRTYRFGHTLAEILDEFVYRTGFVGDRCKNTKITVLDAPRGFDNRDPRISKSEASVIAEYLERAKPKEYAILTPYRAQIKLLQAELKNVNRDDIYTIHRSQGREWDTVIISAVDTVQNKFFMDSRNAHSNGLKIINTAISRAKKELVIACDSTAWQYQKENQLLGRLIDYSLNPNKDSLKKFFSYRIKKRNFMNLSLNNEKTKTEKRTTVFQTYSIAPPRNRSKKSSRIDLRDLEKIKINIEEIQKSTPITKLDKNFEGKLFIITGDLNGSSRADALKEIVARGGIIKNGAVTTKTDYLICTRTLNNPSTKLKTALKFNEKGYNIQIINEKEFWRMIDGK